MVSELHIYLCGTKGLRIQSSSREHLRQEHLISNRLTVSKGFDGRDDRQLSVESLDLARILPAGNILREQSVARENGTTRAFCQCGI